MVHGKGVARALSRHLTAHTFEELRIPFIAVCTDLTSGEVAPIGAGELIPAVHASAAIPFVFLPVEHLGHVLVDGGVVDPVPVRVARTYKPLIVIAVDLNSVLPKKMPAGLFEVAMRGLLIQQRAMARRSLEEADVMICPDVGEIGILADESPDIAYQAGKRAAQAVLPRVLELVSQRCGLLSCFRHFGS